MSGEVACCECEDLCTPGDDLRNHLRQAHSIKKQDVPHFVGITMKRHLKEIKKPITASKPDDVTFEEEIEPNETEQIKEADETEQSFKYDNDLFKEFMDIKTKSLVSKMFGDIGKQHKKIENTDPKPSVSPITGVEDLKARFSKMRSEILNMTIPASAEKALKAEFEATMFTKKRVNLENTHQSSNKRRKQSTYNFEHQNKSVNQISKEKVMREIDRNTKESNDFKVPSTPEPLLPVPSDGSIKTQSTYLCPKGHPCTFILTKAQMKEKKMAVEHLIKAHNIKLSDIRNQTDGEFKFTRIKILLP